MLFTKWHDKKDVTYLSTNVSPLDAGREVERNVRGQSTTIIKPKVADVYTASMGGVDHSDQLRSFYSTGWQSRKWYRYIFWFLFNISVCNAFVLEGFSRSMAGQTKRTLLEFKRELAKLLINDFSQRKRKARNSLPSEQSRVVGSEQHISGHVEGRKRKCVQCIKTGRRTKGGGKIETRFECVICKVALCRATCHAEFHSQVA